MVGVEWTGHAVARAAREYISGMRSQPSDALKLD